MAREDIRIMQPTRTLLVHLAVEMREKDAAELQKLGLEPLQALYECVAASQRSYVAVDKGIPFAAWGLARYSLATGCGGPWLLTGRGIEKHKRLLLAGSRYFVERMLEDCPRLVVMVDAEYKEALRWLRWLGFRLDEPVPYGPYGSPFCRAEKEAA